MKRQIRIVLIDANESFRILMQSFANSRGLDLSVFRTVLDLGYISSFLKYDVAIVENDLGVLTGSEVGEYLTILLNEMPLILISSGIRPDLLVRKHWPRAIKAYVHKNDGPDAILDSALHAS